MHQHVVDCAITHALLNVEGSMTSEHFIGRHSKTPPVHCIRVAFAASAVNDFRGWREMEDRVHRHILSWESHFNYTAK